MSHKITANELKVRGIKMLEKDTQEILVSVRGVTKYAILPIEYYNKLREFEIAIALQESMADLKDKKYKKESIDSHLKRIVE